MDHVKQFAAKTLEQIFAASPSAERRVELANAVLQVARTAIDARTDLSQAIRDRAYNVFSRAIATGLVEPAPRRSEGVSETDDDFADFIAERYFETEVSKRWLELCRQLDQIRDSVAMMKATVWQRTALMNQQAELIGAALVKRDPSLQSHADALIQRYPYPDEDMTIAELGWSATRH